MTAAPSSPRARYREQTRADIKEIALRQLAEGGPEAVALTRIAKEVGLSGPALYRYFSNRDDLLTSLVRDAYDDAATAIGHAAADLPDSPRAALHLLAGAYLGWASAAPHRYLLIQGSPLPGYAAPPDTVGRARAVLGPFVKIFASGELTDAVSPLAAELTAWAAQDEGVAAWLREYADLAPDDARTGIALAGTMLVWSQLHGTVSLEVSGQYAGMGHRAGTMLTSQMETLADSFRLR
ncbi:TetR/AcrR family transcriptional regulator [Streptomyces beijiangensis]|uniref:TetR/AcrR family transcriptional regulator n=1 Tax=Streptomyces beijiangensis TaxID=163361 RepID=A0A939JFJ8_9ACTN|nr:TetR/AcrR family transcriptional regulator [Streptomyces beijiangensis]MBO0514216.1 TetR/AcrR family transcriptional regulator [Streptomyces beijiangensis]